MAIPINNQPIYEYTAQPPQITPNGMAVNTARNDMQQLQQGPDWGKLLKELRQQKENEVLYKAELMDQKRNQIWEQMYQMERQNQACLQAIQSGPRGTMHVKGMQNG